MSRSCGRSRWKKQNIIPLVSFNTPCTFGLYEQLEGLRAQVSGRVGSKVTLGLSLSLSLSLTLSLRLSLTTLTLTLTLSSLTLALTQGLIRGATADSALVCDRERWLNGPLRFDNEPA